MKEAISPKLLDKVKSLINIKNNIRYETSFMDIFEISKQFKTKINFLDLLNSNYNLIGTVEAFPISKNMTSSLLPKIFFKVNVGENKIFLLPNESDKRIDKGINITTYWNKMIVENIINKSLEKWYYVKIKNYNVDLSNDTIFNTFTVGSLFPKDTVLELIDQDNSVIEVKIKNTHTLDKYKQIKYQKIPSLQWTPKLLERNHKLLIDFMNKGYVYKNYLIILDYPLNNIAYNYPSIISDIISKQSLKDVLSNKIFKNHTPYEIIYGKNNLFKFRDENDYTFLKEIKEICNSKWRNN